MDAPTRRQPAGASTSPSPLSSAVSWLEQLHDIAGRVLEQDLLATRP
jgi:hypothetical protein